MPEPRTYCEHETVAYTTGKSPRRYWTRSTACSCPIIDTPAALELARSAAIVHGFDPAIVREGPDGSILVDLADITVDDLWRAPSPPPVPEPSRVERLAARLAGRWPAGSVLLLSVPILGPALRRIAELEYRRAVRDHLDDGA